MAGRRRFLAVGGIVVGVVVVGTVGGALGAPRDYEVAMSAPTVCSYPYPGFDRTTLVVCSGDAVAIVNHNQILISASTSTAGGPPAAITDASVGGRLHISRQWFGEYRYEFVADTGHSTPLVVTERYVGTIPGPL